MTIFYISKYALTDGIKTLDAPEPKDPDGYLSKNGSAFARTWEDQHHFYNRKEWHRTREAAAERAEQMRDIRIASLKKQIAKLEKLSFAESAH